MSESLKTFILSFVITMAILVVGVLGFLFIYWVVALSPALALTVLILGWIVVKSATFFLTH